jgi:rhodanese-related sulfurtransferase
MLGNLDYKIIFLLIASALCFGILHNSLSKNSLDIIRSEKMLEYASFENSSGSFQNETFDTNKYYNDPLLISIDDAYKIYSTGEAVFIDARDQWDFKDGHIKDALNIPEYKFEKDLPIVKALNKEFSYIVYCGDIECDVSKRLAIELSNVGFERIMILEGGWTQWTEMKYPVETK